MANCNTNFIKGSDFSLLVGRETECGVISTNLSKFKYSSIDIKQEKKLVDSKLIKGGRYNSKAELGNVEVSGKLEVGLFDKNFGNLLSLIFGKVETESLDSGKYLHKYEVADTLPTFSIVKFLKNGASYTYLGNKAKSFSVKFDGEGEVIGEVEVEGISEKRTPLLGGEVHISITQDADSGATQLKIDTANIRESDLLVVIGSGSSTTKAHSKGENFIEVEDGTKFAERGFVEIESEMYYISKVLNNTIVLTTPLNGDIATGTAVKNSQLNLVKSIIDSETIELEKPLSFAVTTSDFVAQQNIYQDLSGEIFTHAKVKISSSEASISGFATESSFSFENDLSSERFIGGNGYVGAILEGVVKPKLSMKFLYGEELSNSLDVANENLDVAVEVQLTSKSGNKLTFNFPTATVQPVSPAISGGGAVSVDLDIIPHTYFSVLLENEVASY